MQLDSIKQYASELLEIFKPHCLRIEIAGSIRREMPECKDIELVVIPDRYMLELWLKKARYFYNFWFLKEGEKYKKFRWKGQTIDLFIATPDNWGWIFFLRTGPWEFNCRALNHYRKIKKFPDMKGSDGKYIIKSSNEGTLLDINGNKIITPEEQDVFDLFEAPFIEPNRRR